MADQVKVEVKAKGPPKFAMKGVQVRKATADEKTAAAATETATDVIAGLVQAPRVASAKAAAAAAAAAPSMVASVFAAKPKKVIAPSASASASAPAPKVQAVQVKPKGQSVLPVTLVAAKAKEESESKEVSEESEKERSEESESEVKPVTENDILIEIGNALDDLKDEEQTYRDLPTEIIGDLTFFEFPLDFTDDELKILDSKFKTLKFTSKGFSGDDGPDFDTDMELLTEMIKRSVLESEKEKEKEKAVPIKKKIDTVLNAKFVPFSEAIVKEEKEDHYLINPAPDAWMPTSRRAFSDYIEKTFEKFIIPPPQGPPDFEACAKQGAAGAQKAETYIYQQFIREYMRQETPYRGILVYHGLGSGKTCSAIATAEALFGTVNKKIVVMTPLSLRKLCSVDFNIFVCRITGFRLKEVSQPSIFLPRKFSEFLTLIKLAKFGLQILQRPIHRITSHSAPKNRHRSATRLWQFLITESHLLITTV